MKNVFLILILSCYFMPTKADEFKVDSFAFAKNDPEARKTANLKKDDHGDFCAIIKVRTDLKDVLFIATPDITSQVIIKDLNEIWVFVSPGTKLLTLKKNGFITKDFPIPIKIEPSNVYVMVLKKKLLIGTLNITTKKETTNGAIVKINDKSIGNMPLTDKKLEEGDYKLTIEKKGFTTITEDIIIKGNAETNLIKNLEEKVITVFINSEPTGATFSIDNVPYGITPNNIPLKLGQHVIELKKDKYLTTKETFLVDEETKSKQFKLAISDYQPIKQAYVRNSIFMYSSLAVMIGGIGLSGYEAYDIWDKMGKYPNATTEATQLHKNIIMDRNILFVSLGTAAIATIPFFIFKKDHAYLKSKLNSVAFVPINNGALVAVKIDF